jgi:Bestrophin, RFP-TM, chloride channel
LTDLFRSARELIQYTCLLTNQNTNAAAQEWRHKVAYQTIVLVRVAVAAVEYRSHGINIWDEVLDEDDHQSTEFMMTPRQPRPQQQQSGSLSQRKTATVSATTTSVSPASSADGSCKRASTSEQIALHSLRHGPRTLTDEHFRAPIVWAYNLRETILQPRMDRAILAQRDWHANESLKLLALVADFVHAFSGLKKLVSTPFPFPLVQMTRTFLFAWVFTLPLVLIGENGNSVIEVLVLTFFCTYGFLGLEYVNMELDDPVSAMNCQSV